MTSLSRLPWSRGQKRDLAFQRGGPPRCERKAAESSTLHLLSEIQNVVFASAGSGWRKKKPRSLSIASSIVVVRCRWHV